MKISRKVFFIFFTVIAVTLLLTVNQIVTYFIQQRFYFAVSQINQLQIQVRQLDQLRLALLLPERTFDRHKYDRLVAESSKSSAILRDFVVNMPPDVHHQLENLEMNLSNFRRSLLETADSIEAVKQNESDIHKSMQRLHSFAMGQKEGDSFEDATSTMESGGGQGETIFSSGLFFEVSSFIHHQQFHRLPEIRKLLLQVEMSKSSSGLSPEPELLLSLLESYYLRSLQLLDRKQYVEASANAFLEQTQLLLTQLEKNRLQRQRLISKIVMIISVTGLLVTVIFWYRTKVYLRRFLHNQNQVMKTIQNGSEKLQLAPQSNDELGDLTTAMKALAVELHSKKTELLASEKKFRSLVENISEMIWETDINNRYSYCSRAGKDITGYAEQEILGKEYLEFSRECEDRQVLDQLENYFLKRQEFTNVERKIHHTDGSIKYLMASGTPLYGEGDEFLGFRGVDHDVTELVTSRKAQKQLEINLQHSQKMESIGRLAGGIAHDFNNILSAILGYSELILEILPKGHQCYRYVDQIKISGDRAAGLTNQLLAFSRKQVHSPEILDVGAEIYGLEDMLRRLAGELIDIKIDIDERVWPVRIDKSQLEQIVTNLTVNAIDAMPDGGEICIAVTSCPADCSCREDQSSEIAEFAGCAAIRITDNGCGIPEDVLPKIFDPFFTTKDLEKGTGLGLAMVYGIVTQNGGEISVESSPGQGSCFQILLPLNLSKVGNCNISERIASEPRRGSEAILLVEDENQLLEMHAEYLTQLGYHIVTARDGSEALAIFQQNSNFDLLITDVVMPRMGGLELAEKMRQINPELRVLYTSGYTKREGKAEDILREGTNFIYKPATPRDIAIMVEQLLGDRQQKGDHA